MEEPFKPESPEQTLVNEIHALVGLNEDVWFWYHAQHYNDLCWQAKAIRKYDTQDLEDAGEFEGLGKTMIEALDCLKKDIVRRPEKFIEITAWRERYKRGKKHV